MEKKITLNLTLKIGINIVFISIILFLMIEVLWAQILKDLILENTDSPMLTGIIISGFLISMIISVLSSLLSSNKTVRKYSLWSALISFIINLFIWILICYISVQNRYPEITKNLNIFEKIIAIPRIIGIFSIYFLSNITLLWMISLVSYAMIFSIVLFLLSRKKSKEVRYNRLSSYKF